MRGITRVRVGGYAGKRNGERNATISFVAVQDSDTVSGGHTPLAIITRAIRETRSPQEVFALLTAYLRVRDWYAY